MKHVKVSQEAEEANPNVALHTITCLDLLRAALKLFIQITLCSCHLLSL